jgi:hypothetical protein
MQQQPTYKIVRLENGALRATRTENILLWARQNNYLVEPETKFRRENYNRIRPELRNQPVLRGLYGPMYDGEENGAPVIRYESPEAYHLLSV